jgi:hypothetical protein
MSRRDEPKLDPSYPRSHVAVLARKCPHCGDEHPADEECGAPFDWASYGE